MSDAGESVPSTAPVLTVVGGAGAMGSLFAELLLPDVAVCLLIDRFPTAAEQPADAPPLWPLIDRLTATLSRAGYQVALTGSEGQHLLSSREARTSPIWLLAGAPSTAPTAVALSGDPVVDAARFISLPDVRKVIGLLTPGEAKEAAQQSDMLLVATHYTDDRQFSLLLEPYAAGLRPGSLVADLLSVKDAPLRTLCRVFPPEVTVLGTHPLFGRTAGDVTGLVVAVVSSPDGRPVGRWQPWLLKKLAERGMLITPTSAGEHDAAMSYVQALTHFALLCFAYTFVRANQDPTLLLPFRTPVFEPLLYLAARVASLAQRTPEVYRAIQAECARPELRRIFVETAAELLEAIERGAEEEGRHGGAGERDNAAAQERARTGATSSPSPTPPLPDPLITLFQTLGAPWTPTYHRDAAPYEQLVAMSSTLTEPLNALRHELVQSAGEVRAMRNIRTGMVALGAIYVDPMRHDRVDLASRLRFHRFNLTTGALDGADTDDDGAALSVEQRRRAEASLASLPLAQVQLLTEAAMMAWLSESTGPRSGGDDLRGAAVADATAARVPARPRYVGKGHFDLSLAMPDWFDDDSLQRLIGGRSFGPGFVTAANVAPQSADGLAGPPATRPAIAKLAVLLHPQRLVALRREAQRDARDVGPEVSAGERRRTADRRFAAAVADAQRAVRSAVLDWLLTHGCSELRRVD